MIWHMYCIYRSIHNYIVYDNNQSLIWRYPVCSSLVYPCTLPIVFCICGICILEVPCAPIVRAFFMGITYHLGSLAFGAVWPWVSTILPHAFMPFLSFHIFPCSSFAWCRNNQDKSDFQKLFARKLHPSLIRCCWHVSDFYMRWWPCFTVRRSQPFAIQICHSYLVDWSNTNESNRSSLGA